MAKMKQKLTGLEKARAVRAANIAKRKTAEAQQLEIDQEESAEEETEQPQEPVRRMARTQVRTPPRQNEPVARGGRITAQGRDGETLMRSRTFTSDQFDIPGKLIPKGWSYQWNTISVHGNEEIASDYSLMMSQNGWRPVPAERYAGTLLPKNAKGSIIRGGERLEERPVTLTEEAKAEDEANARQLISDRNDSLKLTKTKSELGPGFEMGKKYRGTGGDIRMSIDKALDAPRPKYELADDDE